MRRGLSVCTSVCLYDCQFARVSQQDLSCRGQKASRVCKIIRYKQHCYGTVRFIIYITDSEPSGYYSTVESTLNLL